MQVMGRAAGKKAIALIKKMVLVGIVLGPVSLLASGMSWGAPVAADLASPTGGATVNNPVTYTWDAVSDATWYYLWVNDASGNKVKTWYTAGDCGCGSGTGSCSVTPSATLSGDSTWWIQTWNNSGYGPWSSGGAFTVSSGGAGKPAAVDLTSPGGGATVNNPVTYTWDAVDNATWYYLWVNDASGNKVKDWYTAAQCGCGSGTGTCSVTPSATLSGNSTWWVRTWNDSGYGDWSDGLSFSAGSAGGPPAAATLTSPTGTITDTTPTYTWPAVSNATWYYLWVNDASGNRIKSWYAASDCGCASGTGNCSVTPSTSLSAGNYDWWLRTWNDSGYGNWSSGQSFTVSSGGGSTSEVLAGDITSNMTLTSDKVWALDGLVAVKNGAVLTIEPGTTIVGKSGTGANTSYLVVDKGSKIYANGTAANPITFTSEIAYNGGTEAPGQWGGLTIIGNAANAQVGPYECNSSFVPGTTDMADNSGSLTHVHILNSGITMEQDKEINGLSLVGVGSGTTIDHVTVKRSDDDGIEIWGGTVNLSNCYVEYATDDQFDIDDGYSGTVTNLTILQHTDGNAGIEMSGTTAATFIGLKITQNYSDKEGAIYFKKDGIGGHFQDCTIIDNVDDGQTLFSQGDADEANISFTNVAIISPDVSTNFVDDASGGSATDIEARFAAGTGNTETTNDFEVLAGDITSNMTLTSDKVWALDGLVAVKNGAVLTIEAGTTIVGKSGTGANTSYLVVDKGSKIYANGTAANPITFTSEIAYNGGTEAPGQWGGLTIIGNAANAQVGPYECNSSFVPGTTDMADNSGSLTHVHILNSGITMEQDKEINGLSLVGVGSGTTIDHVTVKRSDDDGIEIWGGTVNLSNCYVEYATDDQFDIDDGYSGTVTNLTILQHTDGNAGIEMSGTTAATFIGLQLTQNYSDKEGAIYFKKDGIGGHFENCTIIDNVDDGQTIFSQGDADEANISFTNVSITSPDTSTNFVDDASGGSAADIEARFNAGTGNTETQS